MLPTSAKVKVDGKLVDEESEKLENPLAAGYAFGLQQHYDDYTKGAEEGSGTVSGDNGGSSNARE